jgi:hypothetical protein
VPDAAERLVEEDKNGGIRDARRVESIDRDPASWHEDVECSA